MNPKPESPAVKSAKKVKRKYSKGFTLTSSQSLKTRRALSEVSQGDISVSKCAKSMAFLIAVCSAESVDGVIQTAEMPHWTKKKLLLNTYLRWPFAEWDKEIYNT